MRHLAEAQVRRALAGPLSDPAPLLNKRDQLTTDFGVLALSTVAGTRRERTQREDQSYVLFQGSSEIISEFHGIQSLII